VKALRLGLVLLAAWAMGVMTMNCVVQHLSPQQRLPLVHTAANDCRPLPPVSLLPRDHWEGFKVIRSKDGGTV
jgi:hypothetical protein